MDSGIFRASHRPRSATAALRDSTVRDEMSWMQQRSRCPRFVVEPLGSSARLEQRLRESSQKMERRLEEMRRMDSPADFFNSVVPRRPRSAAAPVDSSARRMEQRLLESLQCMEFRLKESSEGRCGGFDLCSQREATPMVAACTATAAGSTWPSRPVLSPPFYDDDIFYGVPASGSSPFDPLDAVFDSSSTVFASDPFANKPFADEPFADEPVDDTDADDVYEANNTFHEPLEETEAENSSMSVFDKEPVDDRDPIYDQYDDGDDVCGGSDVLVNDADLGLLGENKAEVYFSSFEMDKVFGVSLYTPSPADSVEAEPLGFNLDMTANCSMECPSQVVVNMVPAAAYGFAKLLHNSFAMEAASADEWEASYEVALGVAHNTAYLHLDGVWEPYLVDFGLTCVLSVVSSSTLKLATTPTWRLPSASAHFCINVSQHSYFKSGMPFNCSVKCSSLAISIAATGWVFMAIEGFTFDPGTAIDAFYTSQVQREPWPPPFPLEILHGCVMVQPLPWPSFSSSYGCSLGWDVNLDGQPQWALQFGHNINIDFAAILVLVAVHTRVYIIAFEWAAQQTYGNIDYRGPVGIISANYQVLGPARHLLDHAMIHSLPLPSFCFQEASEYLQSAATILCLPSMYSILQQQQLAVFQYNNLNATTDQHIIPMHCTASVLSRDIEVALKCSSLATQATALSWVIRGFIFDPGITMDVCCSSGLEPWSPPLSVYIICSDLAIRPVPWPNFVMHIVLVGSFKSYVLLSSVDRVGAGDFLLFICNEKHQFLTGVLVVIRTGCFLWKPPWFYFYLYWYIIRWTSIAVLMEFLGDQQFIQVIDIVVRALGWKLLPLNIEGLGRGESIDDASLGSGINLFSTHFAATLKEIPNSSNILLSGPDGQLQNLHDCIWQVQGCVSTSNRKWLPVQEFDRFNRCMETFLSCSGPRSRLDWSEWMSVDKFWYNTSFCFAKERELMTRLIHQHWVHAQDSMRCGADNHKTEHVFPTGNWVCSVSYKLQLSSGSVIHSVFNVTHLKKTVGRAQQLIVDLPSMPLHHKVRWSWLDRQLAAREDVAVEFFWSWKPP